MASRLRGIKLKSSKATEGMASVKMSAPKTVTIPMSMHIGKPVTPIVKVGSEVKVGTLIAEDANNLSAPIYSSVSGKVTKLTDVTLSDGKVVQMVVIESDGEMTIDENIKKPEINSKEDYNLTTKIAITGKSGSGKTTITRAFLSVIKEKYPEKSILLFDNDLAGELGHTFGLDIRNTIYGIRSGKHEYRTGIPQHMTKHEYVEWAIEDIIVQLDENVDIIVSWLTGSKDCRCPITEQLNDALQKVIERYDFVIFDCEFDLKYLNLLVDYPINEAIIVSMCDKNSISVASKIADVVAIFGLTQNSPSSKTFILNEHSKSLYVTFTSYEAKVDGE